MLDPLQFYCRVLCNGMKTRFRMVMIAHPGPGIGFHKRFMWQIIIPPTMGHGMVRVGPRKAGVSPKGNIEGVFTGSPAVDEWSVNIKSAGVVEVGRAYSASSMAPNWWVL